MHDVVRADLNADGFQDLVRWERDGAGRKLVLHHSNEESNPVHTIALYADNQAVDQNADLLLLWREGHPFPSLVSLAGIHPNLDGRLSEPLLPQAWSGSDPVQFAGGDLNRDGFDDVLYFPAEEATWFAVLLSQGDGSFGIPETYLEPAGVRAINVADIDLDGHAEVIVMGNMHLVLWEGR